MEIGSDDRELLERLEEELWPERTRFDTQRMEELIPKSQTPSIAWRKMVLV